MLTLDHHVTLLHGDVADALPLVPTNAAAAVITDPPYALDMGYGTSGWDTHRDPVEFAAWCASWGREALRITRPGGWLLAAGGRQTWHRLCQGLEDAGWEIVDSIDWVYPKSRHPSVDLAARLRAAGYSDDLAAQHENRGSYVQSRHEPFVLARAPLDRTLLHTIDTWGTGSLDVLSTAPDAAPGPTNVLFSHAPECDPPPGAADSDITGCVEGCPVAELGPRAGLFPVFRWSDRARSAEKPRLEVAIGEGTTHLVDGRHFRRWRCASCGTVVGSYLHSGRLSDTPHVLCSHPEAYEPINRNDYTAEITHNTIKPLDLTRWMVRLLTRPGDLVLEPFAGSHSTVEACVLERRRAVAVERDRDSVDLGGVRLRRQGARLVSSTLLTEADPTDAAAGSGSEHSVPAPTEGADAEK